eukprot:2725571-Pyramimonas_sp.AAC.1
MSSLPMVAGRKNMWLQVRIPTKTLQFCANDLRGKLVALTHNLRIFCHYRPESRKLRTTPRTMCNGVRVD